MLGGGGQKGSSVFESISNTKTETSCSEHGKGSRSTLRVSADLETFPLRSPFLPCVARQTYSESL